jgi:hypothetical protein
MGDRRQVLSGTRGLGGPSGANPRSKRMPRPSGRAGVLRLRQSRTEIGLDDIAGRSRRSAAVTLASFLGRPSGVLVLPDRPAAASAAPQNAALPGRPGWVPAAINAGGPDGRSSSCLRSCCAIFLRQPTVATRTASTSADAKRRRWSCWRPRRRAMRG